MCGTEIQHKASHSSKDDGGKSACLSTVAAFTAERFGYIPQPVFNGVVQEDFVESWAAQRHTVSLKEKTKEGFGIRGAHAFPDCLASFGKSGSGQAIIGGALPVPDFRQNFTDHFFFRAEVVEQNTRCASESLC